MKRIILSYLLLLAVVATSYAQQDSTQTVKPTDSVDVAGLSVADQATALYNDGDFRRAIEILEKEKKAQQDKGLASAELYYNLGNAYFRVNDLAEARLNYERALLLDPGDRDTRHNIEFLSTKLEDKILVADTFFLSIWFSAVQNLFSSNAWAKIAVSSFLLLMGCFVAFFFGKQVLVKKSAFYAGIALLVLVVLSNVFAFRQKDRIENRSTAIVMAATAPMKSSPDINSKEMATLHAGTKVRVTKQDRNWFEIQIDNGTVGWMQKEKLEII